MKFIKYLMLAFTGGVFYSCDVEEFLNPLPETAVTADTYFQSDADVVAGIIGIYDAIQGVNEATDSDDTDVNRGIQYEYLLTEHRSDNTRSATLEGSRADFHRYLTDPVNTQSEDYWASMYDIIFRANNVLTYMDVANPANVARYTGEAKFLRAYAYFNLVRLYGDVPLITEVAIPNDRETLYTRVDVATVYAQIVQDLDEAATVLDNTYKSRASKAAAQGLLAKVLLSQPNPDYQRAQVLCEDVMSQGFSLMPNFYDVFYSELNDEIIFAIQYQSGNPLESQGFSAEFTSAVRQGFQDGLNIPNDNLIADLNTHGGDRAAVSITNVQGSIEVAKFLPDGNDWTNEYGGNARNAGNDWIILRYSDILLMHVEAIMGGTASTGNPAALASFQAVRNRAGLTTPVTSISQEDLLLERRVEFAFENQRWFDLQRFGVADAVLSAHATDMGYADYNARALLLPIPAREINLSGGLMTQNP
ncbi:RagB/SusD family nutrient uptake outer membrane protein [Fulvivirga ulvae]|uniref:RagB/SusD family nutrient uptake outer membrane protein n=1 Tax=Fulvivirga ulvae TaxID=2904245 RepID=UPI001F485304|nr:RagB/SusD family nutrient uptake outer membrane protein [Fulvivirga ulvae]UII31627.1 RagB/SusD family nutrient uptake outer membrane protein [Fulvivirga ulvae]